ncbi:DNA mismatch repair protein Msh3-like [Stigmatopora nigra]
MPKAAKKSRASQPLVSRYFKGPGDGGGAFKSRKDSERPNGKKRPLEHSEDDVPSKEARLSLKGDDGGRNRLAEKKLSLNRGAGQLCPSTLERLKGFSCMIMPGVTALKEAGGPARRSPAKVLRRHANDDRLLEKGEEKQQSSQPRRNAAKGGRDNAREDSRPSGASAPHRRSKGVYTPLEQQVVQLKEQYKDALLAVECGYKYRFFGEDAEIAAKELNIVCYLDHNFMTCSVPTHRLFIHVRRLVARGHKVGVVKQTETSAIKALGVNKNALFQRQLSALYTKSTLVGQDVNPVGGGGGDDDDEGRDATSDPVDGVLLCISEKWDKSKKKLTVGLVAVVPCTGEVQMDSFHDVHSRCGLESRVLKMDPAEILVPSDLSAQTQKLLQSIGNASARADDKVRVEKRDSAQFEFAAAMNTLTEFYCQDQAQGSRALAHVGSLESPIICCLGPLVQYLQEFNLERVLRSQSSFQRLTAESEGMILTASSLRNLEILQNQTDNRVRGSLLWVLDHTSTPFGKRLMRKWLTRPLTDAQSILERQDAVQEILESDSLTFQTIKSLLVRLPDLERGICSIFNKKSSTQEFYLTVGSLCRLSLELLALLPTIRAEIRSDLVRSLLEDAPELLSPAQGFLASLDQKAAKCGNKTELFADPSSFPALRKRRAQIQEVLRRLEDHLKDVRRVLKNPALDYVTVAGQEFMIEVKNRQSSLVPDNWLKVGGTKLVSRYHSPFVAEHLKKLLQLRERLLSDCQKEWSLFLDHFGEHYHTMKRAISHLATMDCLFSLAQAAKHGDYCRPQVSDGQRRIVIEDGRHPAIELLTREHGQYVANHVDLRADGQRTMIITGPNMGGKSSYLRQVALICVMAQIGSYVPASGARLGILDGVYTRMGASDDIQRGRSTFMEELSQASEMISRATDRSLVILDELGRGTSTHDGVAIAHATLRHLITVVKCFTLFVTHFPPLRELERVHPRHVSNYHTSFLLNDPEQTEGRPGRASPASPDQEPRRDSVTFLYRLSRGASERSYGLNVARLAEIPESVLRVAALKARELEDAVRSRRRKKLLSEVWSISDKASLDQWLHSNCL